MSGRARSRRSITSPGRCGGCSTSAGTSTRAAPRSRASRSARARSSAPVAQYSHARGCSITGGYVYRGSAVPAATGRYFYGDYCSGTVWSLKLVGGVARQIRAEPFIVANLTSFGEDGAGELYAVSGNGVIYRSRYVRRRDLQLVRSERPRGQREPPLQASDADRDADRVDQDVVPGAVTPTDEMLVDLVARRVERPRRRSRRHGRASARSEKRAEHGVLGQVRELAQDEIPGAEAGAEARDRREARRSGRPEDDRRPASGNGCCRHRPMIGSAVTRERGEGTRCESGTVPPL